MDRTYQKIEVIGVSNESFEDAVRKGVESVSKNYKGLSWFEVKEMRGRIENNTVQEFQVTISIGCRIVP